LARAVLAVDDAAPGSVREGTATRRAGKETARRILAAARSLLTSEGYAQFSMRNVAEAASLRLANLQYYFPRRDDLVRAILADTGDMYAEAYERVLDGASDDPTERFKIVLDYQLKDIFVPETRRYFIQLWALLNSIDDASGTLIGELYAYDIGPLGECIQAMYPKLDKREVAERARLLAATIEGLMIVRGEISMEKKQGQALFEKAYRLGLAIACGDLAD
jgi:AcrR family transcriptional regulator